MDTPPPPMVSTGKTPGNRKISRNFKSEVQPLRPSPPLKSASTTIHPTNNLLSRLRTTVSKAPRSNPDVVPRPTNETQAKTPFTNHNPYTSRLTVAKPVVETQSKTPFTAHNPFTAKLNANRPVVETQHKTPFTSHNPYTSRPNFVKTALETQPKTPFTTQNPSTSGLNVSRPVVEAQPKTPFTNLNPYTAKLDVPRPVVDTQPKTPFAAQNPYTSRLEVPRPVVEAQPKTPFTTQNPTTARLNNPLGIPTTHKKPHSEPTIKYHTKVNDKTYAILRKIGSGGSAKVYEGFEPQTSRTVAIKIINVGQATPQSQESFFNEITLLTRLRDSKHVVHMYDSEYKAECKELVIVMEKGDTDLSSVIESHFSTRNKQEIDGIFIKFYWRGMLKAVDDIHTHGIIHADLKPVNFILVKNEIKLIDFGIANIVEEGTSILRDYIIGTINYMAPEALRNRALDASFQYLCEVDENNQQKRTVIKYNSKVDIWSLGCNLYNLVYGRPPFDKYDDIASKVQAITNPNHEITFPEISNQNLLNCMKSCLRYNPADRPSAKELLQHPYLREDLISVRR